jgi:hypothetical protein
MRPQDLLLRCYIERVGDQWQAFCVDLNLAAQADSLHEAKTKLDSMVRSYLIDALTGEDRAHAAMLLTRKAPLRFRAKYNWYAMRSKISTTFARSNPRDRIAFRKPMPMHVSAAC